MNYATVSQRKHDQHGFSLLKQCCLSAVPVSIFIAITFATLPSTILAAENHPSINYPTDLAPSARLTYRINADTGGIALTGEAKANWTVRNSASALPYSVTTYSITTETRAPILGKILEANSSGNVDSFGLAPNKFEEKRRTKSTANTTFNRDTKTITFSESDEMYPIKGGEQDRTSAIWQLVSIARASPKKFIPKSQWTLFVAGRRDAEKWTFTVDKAVTVSTPLGKFDAVHIIKTPPPDAKEQRVDIWLAPKLEWYPVRMKFSDANGDTIDQHLVRIER